MLNWIVCIFRTIVWTIVWYKKKILIPIACPSGFKRIGDFCFVAGTGEKTFEDATAACQELGGFLVEPRSEEISTAVKTFNISSKHIWIGLRDNAKNRNFLWQTDNAALSYNDWDPYNSQPNNRGGNQNCVALIRNNYRWHDIGCDLRRGYLCQAHRGEQCFP